MRINKANIAVTGLNATDNPGPGVSVIRSLRSNPAFRGRIIGLAYDTLDPGAYAQDIVDDVFIIPYPSQGASTLEARLRYIRDRIDVDVIIPTLDAELPSFIALESALRELSIGTFLPTREQYDLRSKIHLAELGRQAEIDVPKSLVIPEVDKLYSAHERVPYPFWVKGLFYGATLARSIDEAIRAYHQTVARWGGPVIIQESVPGEELDVVAVGDGRGGLIGAVPMKKTYLTDKGKGWAGIAIKDPDLLALSARFIEATKWRGPCEVEVIRSEAGEYKLLEVNPRFPAWTYLSAGAGMNLAYAVARLALGEEVEPLTEYRVGTMFVRISIDQIASLEDFRALAAEGELHRKTGEEP